MNFRQEKEKNIYKTEADEVRGQIDQLSKSKVMQNKNLICSIL